MSKTRTRFVFLIGWMHVDSWLYQLFQRAYQEPLSYWKRSGWADAFRAWVADQREKAKKNPPQGVDYGPLKCWLALGRFAQSLKPSDRAYSVIRSCRRVCVSGSEDLTWSPTGSREDPRPQPWWTWPGSPEDLTTDEYLATYDGWPE